jgi:hypothetical protein
VELADATHLLLYEFAQQYKLGHFGKPGLDQPPSQS